MENKLGEKTKNHSNKYFFSSSYKAKNEQGVFCCFRKTKNSHKLYRFLVENRHLYSFAPQAFINTFNLARKNKPSITSIQQTSTNFQKT